MLPRPHSSLSPGHRLPGDTLWEITLISGLFLLLDPLGSLPALFQIPRCRGPSPFLFSTHSIAHLSYTSQQGSRWVASTAGSSPLLLPSVFLVTLARLLNPSTSPGTSEMSPESSALLNRKQGGEGSKGTEKHFLAWDQECQTLVLETETQGIWPKPLPCLSPGTFRNHQTSQPLRPRVCSHLLLEEPLPGLLSP